MEWHWSYQSLPELAQFSRKERRRIWYQCCRECKPKRLLYGALVANVLIVCVLGLLYVLVLDRQFARLYLWVGYLLASFWISDALTMPFMIEATLPRMREIAGNRCISCGYLLVGNTSGRCPECGAEIEGKTSPANKSRKTPTDKNPTSA